MANQAPDVRVRLSATGVQEVVNAFKQIQKETEETRRRSQAAGEGVEFLKGRFEELIGVVKGLTIGAALFGFVELTKQAFEGAANMSKLHDKTGLAVQTISTFSFVAQEAGADTEKLSTGLVKFSKAMNDYDAGNKKTRDSVRQLFGSSKALEGLPLDERFQKITDKLANMEPGAKRTGAAIAFFGKSGADILPVIDEMGGDFAAAEAKMRKFGLAMDDVSAQKMRDAERSINDVKLAVKGAATQLAEGMAPSVEQSANAIGDMVTQGGAFQTAGKLMGVVIRSIIELLNVLGNVGVAVFVSLKDGWEVQLRAMLTGWSTIGGVFDRVIHGDFSGALDVVKKGWASVASDAKAQLNNTVQAWKDAGARIKQVEADLVAKPADAKAPPPRDRSSSTDLGAADKAAKARLDLLQAEADIEARIHAAEREQQQEAEKELYAKGLESLQDYYAHRRAIIEAQGNEETNALLDKAYALQDAPLREGEQPTEKQKQVEEAAAAVVLRRLQLQKDLSGLSAEQAREEQALTQKLTQLTSDLAKAEGDRFAKARATLQVQAQQLDIALRQKGVSEPDRTAQVQQFVDAGTAQIDYNQRTFDLETQLKDLETQRAAIQDKVASGQMFGYQAEQEIAQLEKDRLPDLEKLAALLQETAITDEQKQKAEQLAEQVHRLGIESDLAGKRMAQFKQSIESGLTSDLSNWLSNGIDQAHSLGEALESLSTSIAQTIRHAAAEWASQKITSSIFNKLPGLGKQASSDMGAAKLTTAGAAVSAGGAAVTSGAGALAAAAAQLQAAANMLSGAQGSGGGGFDLGGDSGSNDDLMGGGDGGDDGGDPGYFAEGGLVRGPGSGQSDSINARLSDHEYVVKSAVTRKPGVLGFLNWLNGGGKSVRGRGVPRFASGGLVTAGRSGGGGVQRHEHTHRFEDNDMMRRSFRDVFEGWVANERAHR